MFALVGRKSAVTVIRPDRKRRSSTLKLSRTTISPGTISSTGISLALPSRSTAAVIRTMESNFSTALLAPRSCQNPRRPLARTATHTGGNDVPPRLGSTVGWALLTLHECFRDAFEVGQTRKVNRCCRTGLSLSCRLAYCGKWR
jgi:hypothetical protein